MNKLPTVGGRVRVKSLGIKGAVFYIDSLNLYNHHMSPIQIELDKPYDDSGQTMYRTDVKDIVKLKQKTEETPKKAKPKKKKERSFDDEIFVF